MDTTISHGLTFRVEERDEKLVSDTNGNDGELNYDRGLVSNTSKFTTDLDISTSAFGAFVRASGFMDFVNQNGTRDRTPLSEEAKKVVGRDVELLDAYVTKAFDVGDAAVDLRLGRHVLNWGESTFIPNGINAINPFDVGKLRVPGSELREALLPVSMVSMSVAPNDTVSLEGFYQLVWEKTEIDPVGSYFSSTDYAGPGARKAVITTISDALIPGHQKKRPGGRIWTTDTGHQRGPRHCQATTPASVRSEFCVGAAGPRPHARRLRPVGARVALPCRGPQPDRVWFPLDQLSQPGSPL